MTTTTPPPEGTVNLWNQMLSLVVLKEIPSREEFVNALVSLGALQGLLLLVVGGLYLTCGWKAFKALVIINAGILGAVVGGALGGMVNGPSMQTIGAIAGGLLLGVLSWPLMKYAVAIMGGLVGSVLGYAIWDYAATVNGSLVPGQQAWAGALIGLVVLGMLAFVVFRESIILLTSLQGAVLAVSGGLGALMTVASIRESLRPDLIANVHLLPILVLVPAVIGVAFQHAELAKKARKKASKQPAPA